MRWRHPTRGLVAIEFIPFAEQTGYIGRSRNGCSRTPSHSAQWRFNGLPMNVSINLSTRDLVDDAAGPVRGTAAAASVRLYGFAWRSPRARSWTTPVRSGISSGFMPWAAGWPSTTTARLFVAGLPPAAAGAGTQDRQVIRHRMAGDASDALIVRSTIDLAHNSAVGGGGRRRGRRDPRSLAHHGLRHGAGLPAARAMGVAETAVWMRGSVWTAGDEPPSLRRVV